MVDSDMIIWYIDMIYDIGNESMIPMAIIMISKEKNNLEHVIIDNDNDDIVSNNDSNKHNNNNDSCYHLKQKTHIFVVDHDM